MGDADRLSEAAVIKLVLPEARDPYRLLIGPCDLQARRLPGFVARFINGLCRNNSKLPAFPGITERGLVGDLKPCSREGALDAGITQWCAAWTAASKNGCRA